MAAFNIYWKFNFNFQFGRPNMIQIPWPLVVWSVLNQGSANSIPLDG